MKSGFNLRFVVPLDGQDIVFPEKIYDAFPGNIFRAVKKVSEMDNAVGALAPEQIDCEAYDLEFAMAVRKQTYTLRGGQNIQGSTKGNRDRQFISNLGKQHLRCT